MYRHIIVLIIVLTVNSLSAQQQLSSAEIYEELEKFNFLGSALYIAAHPDDENTTLISYLSNGLHARTAYLSLTRGDGGQNLIGTEIRELLGVIRSQELQMARATDGGQQFFTRANDFGYSKHPDETLEIWNKDQVFADLVYTIRAFRPDIIINRFDHRTPGKTHGHHTSSAMLSVEAFDKTNDPTIFPEQLSQVEPWQVTRQFFNTSWWFYGSREKFAKADKSNLIGMDVGVYYPTLGISNNEISAFARSKHRSQGFGSAGRRGSSQEYIELINGDMPTNKENIFEGVNTSWSRVKGGARIKNIMSEVLENFNFKDPSQSLPMLLEIHDAMKSVQDPHWKSIKQEHLEEIIVQCAGMHIEAVTDVQQGARGDSLELQLEVTNRSNLFAKVNQVSINGNALGVSDTLASQEQKKWFKPLPIAKDMPFSNPYWLEKQWPMGTYVVDKMEDRIKPQSRAPYTAAFDLEIEGRKMTIHKDVQYKYVDPAIGEIRKPFVVIPDATITFDKEMYLVAKESRTTVEVKVRAGKDKVDGTLSIKAPKGWRVNPPNHKVSIPSRGIEQTVSFELVAPNKQSTGDILAQMTIDGVVNDKTLINIDYEHIPLQTILLPAKSKVVKVPLETGGTNIGYIMGAGDKMPESLSNVGYDVELLDHESIANTDLSSYDAIVIGIRAYNTLKSLKLYNNHLYEYAEKGGTLVVQYNTSRRLNFDDLAPYPIKLSRKRVTDEYAPITVVNENHKVVNYPNKISSEDFDDWVQERGLYFAEEWDDAYETIISCHDKGEEPLEGSLLVAPHGDGYFVYTSISWFRQLPAGVTGAYRLFSNILALSNSDGE